MKKNFRCPHCRAVLNPNVKIVFVVSWNERRGLLLLNARPGDYGLIADPDFSLEAGDVCDFFCPVCDTNLESKSSADFVEVVLDHGNTTESKVEFSRMFGKHATFIIDGREVSSYGEDAGDFGELNFFGH